MSVVLVVSLLVTSVPASADDHESSYTIGVQSGTTSDTYAAESLPNAVVMGYDTIDLAINALEQGDVDFVLGDLPTLKFYEADSDGLYIAGDFGAEDFGIGVAPGESDLLAAIDVALGEIIDSGEYDTIFADTFGDEIVVLTDDTTEDTATEYPTEPSGTLEFALNSGVLVFGSDTTYPPFESLDDDGNCVGFDCDMADAIAARIATAYDQELVAEMKTKTWDELLAFTYDDYDATLSAMTKTAQRAENTDFSRAYYSSKQGILGSEDSEVPGIESVEDLNGAFVREEETNEEEECPVDDEAWCEEAMPICADEDSDSYDMAACGAFVAEFCETEGNEENEFCAEINEECSAEETSSWSAVIGVQSGTTSDTYAAESLPNAVVMGYDTIDLAINALEQGDVDFVLGDLPTLKFYEADSDGLYIAGDFGAEDFGIGVAPGESDLLAAIDVALGEIIDSGEYDTIFADTFGDEIVVLTDDTTEDTATEYPTEPSGTLEFALNSGVLVFGSDTTYPPFESLDDDGNCVGFDCDMADAIAARIATAYDQELVAEMKTKTWDELLAFTYDDYDATLSAMTKTAQRAENTDFSRAYYSSKQGILGSDHSPEINGVEDLDGLVIEEEMDEEDIAFCTGYEEYEPEVETTTDETTTDETTTDETTTDETEELIEEAEAADEVPSINLLVSVLAIGLIAVARRKN